MSKSTSRDVLWLQRSAWPAELEQLIVGNHSFEGASIARARTRRLAMVDRIVSGFDFFLEVDMDIFVKGRNREQLTR